MENSFLKKAMAFGEVHGIASLNEVKLGIISGWVSLGYSVSVLLERDFVQQAQIEEWLISGKPGAALEDCFREPKTAQFLDDQYNFLDQLSYIYRVFIGKIRIFCVDIAFTDPTEADSKLVLAADDEDLFDLRREQFIINRMHTHREELNKSDRIAWFAGNMHASKTANYFPRIGECSNHIKTAAMWLHEMYGLESVYTLPFSGQLNYQSKGSLKIAELRSPSAFTNKWFETPFDGLRATNSFPNMPEKFKESYDWIYGLKTAIPARSISEKQGSGSR